MSALASLADDDRSAVASGTTLGRDAACVVVTIEAEAVRGGHGDNVGIGCPQVVVPKPNPMAATAASADLLTEVG